MNDPRCFFHSDEPPPTSKDYLTCFECGHVFRTVEEFIDAVRKAHDEYRTTSKLLGEYDPGSLGEFDPAIWPMCPYCTHDF